ncbi:transposase [Nostoc sp. ChiQUE01b]|uniref:RNA-guided endonuclease InsQ/TnpB family protein n=1 Tax=Nostoc sp. ChiQUE01b TaxID=3075376 RepID=UPI002AD3C44F|nr:transposase [Nostoc sp. ChiQUE01b]MDZ8258480.1 transposase [Nostoc sp. ChiQUE01b]
MSSYGCQQHLINPDSELTAILEFCCGESAKLANCGTYYARQLYFKTGKIPTKFDLHKLFKSNLHFQAMYSHVAQQCLTTVAESFKSYIGLLKSIKKGTVDQRPKLPGYRKGGLALVTYPKADVKLKDKLLRFPLGSKVKSWFGLDAFYLPMPSNLNFADIKEFRILPRNKCFYIEYVYKQHDFNVELDQSKVLGIDHGLNNWLTCVSNTGTSFIIDGKHLKSMNQWYNKQVATIKENKPQGFWNEKLAHITEKRNRQVRDAVNKAARLVINHCLDNKIGTVVFGWNKRQKDNADMGKKNNQKFVQIPTARLKDRIAKLCKQHGIQFVETEESYTSIASFLDNDLLPKFREKPEGWQYSGKRVKRGLYRTAKNILLNADANGAANIVAKVAIKLGLELSGISRVSLIAPLKVRLWTLQESPAL